MNYIVFDLEFNQAFNYKTEDRKFFKCPFEIVQIGAVKLSENLNIISKFDSFVKPQIYCELHPFVREITNISEDSLNTAKTFANVFDEFIEFIGEGISVLCIWGMTDMKELYRNINYYDLDASIVPKEYYNVQFYASKYFEYPKGTNIGLSKAVELFNIPMNRQFHNALNDASYTAAIFQKVHKKRRKPKIY